METGDLTEIVRFNLPPEEAYDLLFSMFSRKRKWKIKSYTEPSLIVVRTGSPILSRSLRAGGLAKVLVEPNRENAEVSFSFDFKMWYFSLLVFDLIDAALLFWVPLPHYLKFQSLYDLFLIGILLLGLIAIPLFGHSSAKEVEAEVIADSKAIIRKRTKQQSST